MKYIRGVVDMNSVYILTRPYLSIGLIPKRVKYFLYGNNFARFPINCFPYDSIGLWMLKKWKSERQIATIVDKL